MTVKEQFIYNTYLATSRKINNQPFRYRKNFDDFETKEEYGYVVKLANFFDKFPNIDIKDFFEAPYFVYNEKYFDLRFFISQKAIKTYTIYQNKFLPQNPDHEQTLQKIKESFVFIFKYCKLNKITFNEYTSVIQPGNQVHDFVLHLKNRNTIIYSLFTFPNFDKILLNYDKDIKEFILNDLYKEMNFYRTKYHCSNKTKKLCNLLFQTLNSKLTTI